MSLADLRKAYAKAALDEGSVETHPLKQFLCWLDEAQHAGVLEPNAMTLATATGDGRPSARIVLLKGADDRGLVFYTDTRSRKGRELAANAFASLVFWWADLERQIRVEGRVEPVSDAESNGYFGSRPDGSKVSAWASQQSEVVSGRGQLETQWADIASRFAGADVPRPPYWGGFRVVPERYEFWQGRPNRLHDRIRYRREQDGAWRVERLSP